MSIGNRLSRTETKKGAGSCQLLRGAHGRTLGHGLASGRIARKLYDFSLHFIERWRRLNSQPHVFSGDERNSYRVVHSPEPIYIHSPTKSRLHPFLGGC